MTVAHKIRIEEEYFTAILDKVPFLDWDLSQHILDSESSWGRLSIEVRQDVDYAG